MSVKCAYVNAWDVPLLTASILLRDLAAGLVGYETLVTPELPAGVEAARCCVDKISVAD